MKKRPCLLYRMFVRNPHLARYCNECGLEQKLTSAEAEIEKLKVELCDSMPVAKHYESVRRSNLKIDALKEKLEKIEKSLSKYGKGGKSEN
jgi:nicotinic acid phosphoribosyltransferase